MPEEKDYKNHRSRVKRSFLRGGFQSFDAHNALEMILFYAIPQRDTKGLARALIRAFGSFDRVLEAEYESLLAVPGVGEHTAILLKLLLESYRYYDREKNRAGFYASSTSAAIRYAKSLFVGEQCEVAYLMCFDGTMRLQNCTKIAEGSVNAASVTLRRVVETAALQRASAVILTHNHPGGNAIPSAEDITSTKNILEVLRPIGIELLDHIVVSGRNAVSMADSGVIFDMKEECEGS